MMPAVAVHIDGPAHRRFQQIFNGHQFTSLATSLPDFRLAEFCSVISFCFIQLAFSAFIHSGSRTARADGRPHFKRRSGHTSRTSAHDFGIIQTFGSLARINGIFNTSARAPLLSNRLKSLVSWDPSGCRTALSGSTGRPSKFSRSRSHPSWAPSCS